MRVASFSLAHFLQLKVGKTTIYSYVTLTVTKLSHEDQAKLHDFQLIVPAARVVCSYQLTKGVKKRGERGSLIVSFVVSRAFWEL